MISSSVLKVLTRPADAQAETALRENSNTIREEIRVPTRDRSTAEIQNWTTDIQFLLSGLLGEDDLCLHKLSASLSVDNHRITFCS